VASGSSGNCYFIEYGGNIVFVDAGVPLKNIIESTDPAVFENKQVHLFITHEHHDHIAGLRPFINRFAPKIYTSHGTASAISAKDIDTSAFFILEGACEYDFDGFSAIPFDISHDCAEPFGFRFNFGEKVISFATDLGTATKDLEYFLSCSDLLILESNYEPEMLANGPYPKYLQQRIASHKGHLSNKDALKLIGSICDTGIGRVLLAHVSEENNDYELLGRYADFCCKNYSIPTSILRREKLFVSI
jgi:phosphoribosyl 1,2-cyclic phosphodiesterase